MKVLFFCNLVPTKMGAMENLFMAMERVFKSAGDELIFYLGGEPREEVACAWRETGLNWSTIPGWTDDHGSEHSWVFWQSAQTAIHTHRPDVCVVHFGNELPSMAVLLACKIGGIRPKWIWQQDQQIGKTNALTKRFSRVRCVGMVFDRLVATYDGGKISLIMRGVPAAKISIIRNSVSEYRPLRPKGWLRNELRLAPGCALIVVVSSLIPRKRVNFALRVFTQAFGSGSEGKGRGVLLIVGVGSEESALRDLTLKWGIGELVHFLGRRDDVREILSESDLLLHTSMAEASCYAVVESMAAGIPAVVTDAGAAREMIQDGISGYVLDMDDVEGFSERLAGLAHDAEARRQMGRMAKQRWEQRHKVEDSALQYHALYRTVMNGGSAP